jgi:hypothetical protein
MFRGNEGDAALAVAGGEAYDLMRRAVGEAIGTGEPSGIAETAAWAMVHGLAKLVLEAGVTPERAGAEDVEDLARRVLSALSLTQGSLTAGGDAL